MIYLIFTCSIITPDREQIYKECITDTIQKLSGYPIKFVIVDNTGLESSLLDTIKDATVIYTNTNNNMSFTNDNRPGHKGVKEFFDILTVCDKLNVQDDDIVVKLTGRYTIKGTHFFDILLKNESIYDCFLKCYNVCLREYCKNDMIMGLYGMRYKYLSEINYMNIVINKTIDGVNHCTCSMCKFCIEENAKENNDSVILSMERSFLKEVSRRIDKSRILEVDHLDLYFQGDQSILF